MLACIYLSDTSQAIMLLGFTTWWKFLKISIIIASILTMKKEIQPFQAS